MSDLVTCHDASGDVTFVSPAAMRLLSVRPTDLVAEGLFRRVHIGDRPAYLSAISVALHDGASRVEYRLRCGDEPDTEGWIWVESHMRHLADEKGDDAVVTVTRPGEYGGAPADGAVTAVSGGGREFVQR